MDGEQIAQDFVDTLPPLPEMPRETTYIEEILDVCDEIALAVIRNLFDSLSVLVIDALAPLLTLSIICFGIMTLMGWIEYPIKEFAKKVFFWSVVLGILYSWPAFYTIFYLSFVKTPQAIAASVAAASGYMIPGTAPNAFLDELSIAVFDTMNQIVDSRGMVFPYILWIVMLLFGGMAIFVAVSITGLAKMGTALLLAIAPLFLLAFMFQSTKQLFQSWLQQTLNYSLLLVLISLVSGFFLIMGRAVLPGDLTGYLEFADIEGFIIVSIMLLILMGQLPGIAAALSGGIQLSAGAILDKGKGAVGGTAGLAGKGLLKGGKAGWKKMTGAGKITGTG